MPWHVIFLSFSSSNKFFSNGCFVPSWTWIGLDMFIIKRRTRILQQNGTFSTLYSLVCFLICFEFILASEFSLLSWEHQTPYGDVSSYDETRRFSLTSTLLKRIQSCKNSRGSTCCTCIQSYFHRTLKFAQSYTSHVCVFSKVTWIAITRFKNKQLSLIFN